MYTLFLVIYKKMHLKYYPNYKQYENRSYWANFRTRLGPSSGTVFRRAGPKIRSVYMYSDLFSYCLYIILGEMYLIQCTPLQQWMCPPLSSGRHLGVVTGHEVTQLIVFLTSQDDDDGGKEWAHWISGKVFYTQNRKIQIHIHVTINISNGLMRKLYLKYFWDKSAKKHVFPIYPSVEEYLLWCFRTYNNDITTIISMSPTLPHQHGTILLPLRQDQFRIFPCAIIKEPPETGMAFLHVVSNPRVRSDLA
jgi:hypothetical protein